MRLKPLLISTAVAALVAVAVSFAPSAANATVVPPLVPNSTSVNTGNSTIIVVNLDLAGDTTESTTIVAANGDGGASNASGTLDLVSCNPSCTDSDPANNIVTVEEDNIGSILVRLTVTCSKNGIVTVTAEPTEADVTSVNIQCIAASSGGGGNQFVGDFGQVTVSASPNLLPCQGGTATITATVFDQVGSVLDGAAFSFSTTAGLLTQTADDMATLTLGPNQTSATVTASIADPVAKDVKTATVVVSLACGNFAGEANVSVVVTASPNVIQCGGTSTITASGRDANGHVVAGLGFHFATDVGLLVVQPNDANNESGIATLTLQPGMTSSNVTVSVGTLSGTQERIFDSAVVTVQQFCPGPNINSSVQPGLLDLNASSTVVTCGETVFIGASVRDSKVQVVADNTVVNFLATNGQFLNPDGSYQDGSNVAVNTLSAPTVNGVLNVKYIVGAVQGDVKITAASGDKFGSVTLHATCPNPTSATGGATSSSAAPIACIPIGNNVCITPPNTGDAGLKQ